jgi:ribosomal protein S18 acetylase RimI-like enzyme
MTSEEAIPLSKLNSRSNVNKRLSVLIPDVVIKRRRMTGKIQNSYTINSTLDLVNTKKVPNYALRSDLYKFLEDPEQRAVNYFRTYCLAKLFTAISLRFFSECEENKDIISSLLEEKANLPRYRHAKVPLKIDMKDIVIRKVEEKDRVSIFEYLCAQITYAVGKRPKSFFWNTGYIVMCKDNLYGVYNNYENGVLLGYVSVDKLTINDGEWSIGIIEIFTHFRNKGIGSRVVELIVEDAASKSKTVHAEILNSALPFWDKLGRKFSNLYYSLIED